MRHLVHILSPALIVAGSLGHSTPAFAQAVSLFAPTSAVVVYDPFNGLSGVEDVMFEVQYEGEMPLSARLVITADTQPDFQFTGSGATLEFEIDSAFGSSDITRFDVPITLPSSATPSPISLMFKVPSGQYADHGDMQIDLKVALIDSQTAELLANEKIFTLVNRTPLRAQTNFAGTSAGYENGTTYALIDFEEISAGESRTVNFQVRGNSDVDISMSSENKGRLVNTAAPDDGFINYDINADGVESDLSVPLEFSRRPDKTLNGTRYPLTITIDNMAKGAFAGDYRDIIMIDVTPR